MIIENSAGEEMNLTVDKYSVLSYIIINKIIKLKFSKTKNTQIHTCIYIYTHYQVVVKGEFIPLNMELTLHDNGLEDEAEKFHCLGMDEDFYILTLHIYFNDDLTYAQISSVYCRLYLSIQHL